MTDRENAATVAAILSSPLTLAAYGIWASTFYGVIGSLSIVRWTVRGWR